MKFKIYRWYDSKFIGDADSIKEGITLIWSDMHPQANCYMFCEGKIHPKVGSLFLSRGILFEKRHNKLIYKIR